MFRKLLRRNTDDTHLRLYERIVTQARQPVFYEALKVPDTVDGRFDMIVLHAMLIMRSLRLHGEAGRVMSQSLFDAFFADMDRSLREMGVSDLGVPRRIKKMAQSFYGRAAAYEPAFEAADPESLAVALRRNIYAGEGSESAALALGTYALDAEATLRSASFSEIVRGDFTWPSVAAEAVAEDGV